MVYNMFITCVFEAECKSCHPPLAEISDHPNMNIILDIKLLSKLNAYFDFIGICTSMPPF